MNRSFRRSFFLGCALVLLPVSISVVSYLYLAHRTAAELRQAIAETDRLDPDWRLDDLEAQTTDIPNDQNAALVMIEVADMIAGRWPPATAAGQPDLGQELERWPWEKQFDARLTLELKSAVAKYSAAIEKGERLADLPRGRFPRRWTAEHLTVSGGMQPSHEEDLARVAQLLTWNALLKTQQGDFDGALRSCQAALNAGRSFGDLLSMNSLIERWSCRVTALQAVQRVLAQGEPSAAALERLQELLEAEDSLPLFLNAIRLRRAVGDKFLQAARAGNAGDANIRMQATETTQFSILRSMNRAQEIIALPTHTQVQRMQEQRLLEKKSLRRSPLERFGINSNATFAWGYVELNMNKVMDVHESTLLHQGYLRCAIAAIAIERYRLSEGRWPENMQALVPRFLKQIPTDPSIAGGTVWFRMDDDGPVTLATLRGFRLWHVKGRRQAAE